ncbi:MAG TPA: family 78 glycoside hydrolase catalytic domain [Oceanipulchritudo sp.]|nr:family 78 glycoside hydrolase catalytic domain [Oceanipulchritudo sp.]
MEKTARTVIWKADWIAREKAAGREPVACFRKSFRIAGPFAEARVAVTALGLYELWINGRRVGDAELTPGWTEYRKRVPYQVLDVSGYLLPGSNAIGIKLGNGWYCGRVFNHRRKFYGDFPELLFQLEILSRNGRAREILSDHTWRVSEGPIRESDLYDGEVYDARREMPGWTRSGFDDSGWEPVAARPHNPDVILDCSRNEPVRAIEKLTPVSLREAGPGRWIFDFGQNIVGRARIRVPGENGRRITLRFAEMLAPDGSLYTANYRTARSTDTYICQGNGGFEEWEPVFTFHGFRHLELGGLDPALRPDSDWATGVVLHNDMKSTGSFSCSHPLLNQLQSNIVWGQKGNFLDVPMDCPQRDERMGWTGDAQVFCPTASFNFHTLAFFRKWMKDVCDAQEPNGAIPHVAPSGSSNRDPESPAWGDAVAIVPWELHVRFGDRAILEDTFPAILRWIAYQETDSPGLIRADRGFGDWLQPYPGKGGGNRGDTARPLIGTAYFARSTDIAARIAHILGDEETATRLEALARSIRAAFTRAFLNREGRLSSDTQTAYLLALAFDLLPVAVRETAFAQLVRLIAEANGHLRTGFVGTPLLAPTLTRFGRLDLAYAILLKETYPGWLFSIRQGATTLWERWDCYSGETGFGDVELNSFNHYAYGAIGQWLYETVAGLAPDPDHPGYRHFHVQPRPGGGLTSASARLETAHGTAASSWHREASALVLEAIVPDGSSATVHFPTSTNASILRGGFRLDLEETDSRGDAILKIGPGRHSFTLLPGG